VIADRATHGRSGLRPASRALVAIAALASCVCGSQQVVRAGEAEAKEAYEAAMASFAAGSYDAAIEGFTKAFAAEPIPEALYMIARCHDRTGRADSASAAYERFLVVAPPEHAKAPMARAHLVDALTRVGEDALASRNYPAAREKLVRALALDELAGHPLGAAGTARLRGDYGIALAALGETDAALTQLHLARAGALPPELRVLVDQALVALGEGLPPPKPAASIDRIPPPRDVASPVVLAPKPTSRLPLALGLAGAGAALVAGITVLAVVVATAVHPDLGCWHVPNDPSGPAPCH
jgi:tetratricopeptide (TPR) repeat protein